MQKIKKTLQTLDKYVAFGFDADFCIVRYRMEEFYRKHYGLMAKVLVEEKSYPKEILNFTKREKCFIMNGLILDHKTGYMLKLGENKLVTRAYYGFDRVPHEDLQEKFGNPPQYEHFDPYTCHGEDYMCCLSFLRCYISPMLAHMVHHRKQTHSPEQINVKEILQDAMYAAKRVDEIFVKETVEKRQLDNMLFRQDKLKEIFQKLKAKGKVLFLVSNAPLAYNAAVMEFAFGKDWTSLFDFIISEGGKPNFFLPQNDTPFYETENYKKTERKVTELRPHGLYTGGNAKLLEENIARIAPGKSGRILFFGDNYSTDVLAAEKIDHWDGVCIIEELGDVDFGKEYDDSIWGHWQYEETPYGKVPSFWYSYMSKNVAVCTSLVDSIDMIDFYEQE